MGHMPLLMFEEAVASLKKAGPGNYRRIETFDLEYKPDGSWELYHWAELLYVIDSRGRTEVFWDSDEPITKTSKDGINSLSLLVLGRREFPLKEKRR